MVAADANLKVAARKVLNHPTHPHSSGVCAQIVDGRFKNTGQFCVAPDYVLCEDAVSAAGVVRTTD